MRQRPGWALLLLLFLEHDSCANDLAELNWHVSFHGGKEEAIERACDNAISLNVKLKEDIKFIKQHMWVVVAL